MALANIRSVRGRGVVVPGDDIDTDRIIPARYLKCVTFDGLGAHAFQDVRFDEHGRSLGHPLDDPRHRGASILVSERNFGCGSSREHAPWALTQCGFRAVVSTSFADIFKGNSLKNGLLPIIVPADIHKELLATPGTTLRVDLPGQKLMLSDGRAIEFPLDPFSKECLIEGIDELGYMLKQAPAIAAYEATRVGSINTLQ